MNLYDKHILHHIVNFVCSTSRIRRQREKVVPIAEGRVLEVGAGAALNLPFYDRNKVELIWCLEPSEGMRRSAEKNLKKSSLKVKWISLPAESIPLEDRSVDTVLMTYVLCTIPDWEKALRQMHRVLKPNGRLIFCEHGVAPDESTKRWQRRITPFWKKLSGGCHLDRSTPQMIESGGFRIDYMASGYLKGAPKIVGFHYRGIAYRGIR